MNKVFEAILSILEDCWEKFICSSLPARLMEDDAILDIKSPQTPWIDFFPATLSFQGHIISPKSPSPQKFAWRDILRSRSIGCPWMIIFGTLAWMIEIHNSFFMFQID